MSIWGKKSSASRILTSCTCGGFSPHCSRKHAQLAAQEPSPTNFSIERSEIIGKNAILLVRYPNCTTFGGRKLMLIRGTALNLTYLDPHLLGNGHPVVARFEPTEEGWRMARLCAGSI